MQTRLPAPTRRSLLKGGSALGLMAALPRPARAASPAITETRLVAAQARVAMVGAPYPETDVWCYGGGLPGPEIRVKKGGRLRVLVENRLAEETTVHFHGVRLPNAMDGVPHLTQEPIAPGGRFVYEFDCPDAGTFWYHPHQRSFEQVDRGLQGVLVVEEETPPEVDRDLTWLLDDWRLENDASISEDFGDMHDVAHAGRLGNTVTLNGRLPGDFEVRTGERIRLRLVNAANARIFGLRLSGHEPMIVAMDGQPVEPHTLPDGRLVLGPAMRADLLIDMGGEPGERFQIVDDFYPRQEYRFTDLVYAAERLREPGEWAVAALAGNPVPEPALDEAERHEIVLGGGMMGGMMSAMVEGRSVDIREMMHDGLAWAINGVAAKGHVLDPLLTLERGRSCVLAIRNETAWHHPMHLHGHSFRVISRNGRATARREWQDTVLIGPRESAEIAFLADNPGDWMFHCHVLEHQAGGMTGVIRVA